MANLERIPQALRCGVAAGGLLILGLACAIPEPEAPPGGAGGEGGATLGAGGSGAGQGGKGGKGGKGGSGGKQTGGSGGADVSGSGGGGGEMGNGGAGGAGGSAAVDASSSAGGAGGAVDAGSPPTTEKFSFFVTSMKAMQDLAKSTNGFGGDLRFGKADGLSGADEICRQISERSMPGNGKTWRAFLSVTKGPEGTPVNAIDRIGNGPWYDRRGRLFAMAKADLLSDRPKTAEVTIRDEFPNETGTSNKYPEGPGKLHDNHATLTGSGPDGKLYRTGLSGTCQDWTSKDPKAGRPHIGYAFPRGTTANWISIFDEPGCGAGFVIEQRGGADASNPVVGSSGGYGAIYCFALTP